MEVKRQDRNMVLWFFKALLVAYVVSGISLLLLALLVYRFHLSPQGTAACTVVIYVLSALVGGIIIGKRRESRKFLWGFLIGIMYFVLLLFISFMIYHRLEKGTIHLLSTLLLCGGGGMIGGMFA